MTRNPARAITIVVVVLAAAIAALMLTTSDQGDNTVAAKRTPTTTAPVPPTPKVKLEIGRVVPHSVGRPVHVRRSLRHTLLRKTQRYVDRAIIAPLGRGRTSPGWHKVFDPGVRHFARKRDVADLTEAKARARHERVRVTASKVRVDALGGPDGRPTLVALTWSMRVGTVPAKGRPSTRRHTEFTFAKEFGEWLVTAYQVDVTRSPGKHKKNRKTAAAHA